MRTAILLILVTLSIPQAAAAQDAASLTAVADVHRTHGRFDEAIGVYRQAIAANPGFAGAYRGLGRTLDLMGRHAEARAQYSVGLGVAGVHDDEAILDDLVASYTFERRYEEAASTMRKLADLRVSRRGRPGNAYAVLFDLALASNDLAEAEKLAQQHHAVTRQALEQVQNESAPILRMAADSQLAAQRAIVAARQGRRQDAAAQLEAIRTAIVSLLSTVPADLDNAPSMKLPAGEVAFWLGDMPRAISVLSSLKDLPLLRVALILGQAYERQGDLSRARQQYRRITESRVHGVDLALLRPTAAARLAALPVQ